MEREVEEKSSLWAEHWPLVRVLIAAGFAFSCFGLLLFVWITFGGVVPLKAKSYRFTADFTEGISLQKESDVRIGGVSVGKVKGTELAEDGSNATRTTIELKPDFAPLSSDARAILRQKTLLGETFIELTTGSKSPLQGGGEEDGKLAATASTDALVGDEVVDPILEGGHLEDSQVQEAVQIDEIFNALDEDTRLAFRAWQQNLAVAAKGRGLELNDAFGNLGPFTADANDIVATLERQNEALSQLVNQTGTVFGALTEGERELTEIVRGNSRTFGALAARDRELAEAIGIFPTFNEEARRTIDRVTRFSVNARPLARDLKPVARHVSPTLRDVRRLTPHLQTLFRNLDPLVTSSERGLPQLRGVLREARPVLKNLDPFLANLNPIIRYTDLYEGNVTDFLADPGGALSGSLEQVGGSPSARHALRQISYISAESLSIYPMRLSSNRGNGYVPPASLGVGAPIAQGIRTYDHDCANTGASGGLGFGQVTRNPPSTPQPTSGMYPLPGPFAPIAPCVIAPDFATFAPAFAGAGNVPYVPRDP